MAESDIGLRRLAPRLRVIANGDDEVNAQRSMTSCVVVSDREESEAVTAEGLTITEAQYAAHSLAAPRPLAAVPKVRQEAPRQRKLEEGPAASNAFINVFIEFERGLPDADREKIRQTIERAVNANPDIPAAVVHRQDMLSATVPVTLLHELMAEQEVRFIHASEPLKFSTPEADNSTEPAPRSVPGSEFHRDGQGVLIGLIDVGGFDFGHEDFLDDNGETRFISIWDQRRTIRKSPAKFKYGSEITKAHMGAAVKAARAGVLPAWLLEKQSQASAGSHGTHVASIAAGRHGVCPKADLAAVLVDLPFSQDETERRRFTFSDSSRIAHAVDYLMDLARKRNQPVAINISLGTNGGSHDGGSGVSRWVDSALTAPGVAVCVAAGNAGQEAPQDDQDLGWIFGRIHTQGRVPARGLDVDLEWVVMGDGFEDFSENEMEIWYSAQDRFSVLVQPPGEDAWFEVPPQHYVQNRPLSDGTRVSIFNELYHPANGANYISIYLSPKFTNSDPRGVRSGVWKVRLHGEEVRDGRFNAWLERDDPTVVGVHDRRELMAFPSFFSEKSSVDSHSINSLACGRWVISVANLDVKRRRINITSSQGPTRDNRNKPDVAAPGTDISAANGFCAEPKWISMSGTSMASPYVCGVVGLMMAANKDLTSAQCVGILQRTARPLPGHTFEWCNDAGYGQIDAEAAVREARTFTQRTEIKSREARA